MLDLGLGGFVEVHLDESGATKTNSSTLANNLSWVDEVLKDVVIHSSQGTAERKKLGKSESMMTMWSHGTHVGWALA